MKRMTFLFAVACAALFFLSLRTADTAFASGDDDGAVLSFSKIAGGSYGGVKERSFLVLSNEEEWKALWSRINGNIQPLPPLPEVNFSTHAVAAVFQGRKNSGGYSIGVEAVIEMPDRVTVTVRECEPGPSSIVTSALSSPWEAVAFPLPEKPVLFTSIN